MWTLIQELSKHFKDCDRSAVYTNKPAMYNYPKLVSELVEIGRIFWDDPAKDFTKSSLVPKVEYVYSCPTSTTLLKMGDAVEISINVQLTWYGEKTEAVLVIHPHTYAAMYTSDAANKAPRLLDLDDSRNWEQIRKDLLILVAVGGLNDD